MNHSPELHKKLYALYKQNGLTEIRRELIFKVTDGRTENSADLTTREITALIRTLQKHAPKPVNTERNVKKLFHLCHLYGWQKWDKEKQKDVVDVELLNNWLIKYGKFHKELKCHNAKELAKVTTQFETVVNKLLTRV